MIPTLGYVCSDGGFVGIVLGIAFFMPFCGFPLIVSLLLSAHTKNLFSHILLLMASFFYGIWFVCVMYNTFFINLDHLNIQNALIICVAGICFLPLLLPLWIIAMRLNQNSA